MPKDSLKTSKIKHPEKVRKTKTDAELWARRVKELRLWNMGVTKTEIANQFDLSYHVVKDDINAMAMIEPVEDIKAEITGTLREIRRKVFEKINDDSIKETVKVGYMAILNDACQRLSKMHGLERDQNNFYLTQALTTISTGAANKYDKMAEAELQREFEHRRLNTGTDKP